MKRLALAFCALLVLAVTTVAETDRPQLPHVPRGFDEGRTELESEVKDGLISSSDYVERLFEEADLDELSSFIHLHLVSDENQTLDESLKLDGALLKCRDTAAVRALSQPLRRAPYGRIV